MFAHGVSGPGPEVDATEDDVLFAAEAPASLVRRAGAVLNSLGALAGVGAVSLGQAWMGEWSWAFVTFGGFLIVRRVLR